MKENVRIIYFFDFLLFIGLCKGLLVDGEINKNGHKEKFIVHKSSNIYWLKSKNKSIKVDFMDTFIWDFTKWIIRRFLEDPEDIINKKRGIKGTNRNPKQTNKGKRGKIY